MPVALPSDSILATVSTSTASFTLVVLIYTLGEYATLDRRDRPSPELEPYFLASSSLLAMFWVAMLSLLFVIAGSLLGRPVFSIVAAVLLFVQLLGLGSGVSWMAYKILR